MADTKISALPSATVPLAGTEVFPIVQGGVTKNVSTAALLAAPTAIGSATAASGKFTTLATTDVSTMSVNSANAALTITQIGAGNALLVEDSANPDSSPVVIDTNGNLVIGKTTADAQFQVYNSGAAVISVDGQTNANFRYTRYSDDANTGQFTARKARGTYAAPTSVLANDTVLNQRAFGYDGVGFIELAKIESFVDGTPGTNDMPGRLVFSTTADGASSSTERVRISSTGQTKFSYSAVIETTDNVNAALRITQLGTGNALLVEDETNPDSSPFVIDARGRVLVGNTVALNVGGNAGFEGLQVSGVNASADASFTKFVAGPNSPIATFAKSRGATLGTNTVVQASDETGRIVFSGADGTGYVESARISSFVDGTPGLNDMPGRLVFSTTADGAATPTDRVRIDTAGNVAIISPGCLGYGAGAGGAVTQGISRTTGVTLSKPTGAITLFTDLGSSVATTFTVTNTLVAATDTIILSVKSSTNKYLAFVTAVTAGSFEITFQTTGGIASDTPVINFAVIKGAIT